MRRFVFEFCFEVFFALARTARRESAARKVRAVDARQGLAWVSVGDPPVSVVRFGRVVEEPSQPKRGHDQFAGR